MSTTLTAKEFLIEKGISTPINEKWRLNLSRDCYVQTEKDIQDAMIEFAKMHCEAALKAALESIPCLGSSTDIATYEEVEDAVLNSYPLTNIK